MVLKFYSNVAKRLKLKVRKFLGLIPPFGEVTGENLVKEGGGGSFFSPSFHTYGIELKSKREISNFRLVKKTVFTNLLSSKHEKYVKAIYYSG